MGSGASARRQQELEHWKEKDLKSQADHDKELAEITTSHEEKVKGLQEEASALKERLREVEVSLKKTNDDLQREQHKNTALMYSDLPLKLLKNSTQASDFEDSSTSLSKAYNMVTLTQCDVVGFARLCNQLQPHEVVSVVDSVQAIIDKTFTHKDIFIMERRSDGCIAASGLIDCKHHQLHGNKPPSRDSLVITPFSMADSSYGSQLELEDLEEYEDEFKHSVTKQRTVNKENQPHYYASLLATAALKMMSLSIAVEIPPTLRATNKQLQLRIALHSGPVSAGVIGLQTIAGAIRVPHYKLFGVTVSTTQKLCSTSLALQVRVSKSCRDLLVQAGGFKFERCPDFMMWSTGKPIESYWLVGKEDEELNQPSLDLAVSLSEYEDIEM